jgi:hypothetical protein
MSPTLFAAAAVILSSALPFVLLRWEGRRRYRAFDASSYAVGAGLFFLARFLGLTPDWYLAAISFFSVKVAVLFAWSAALPVSEVRWNANSVALASLLVYLALIPAMMRSAVDGDEPFYLLMTESLVRDHDLDLQNQYRDLGHSQTGRTDLVPQPGDPVGPRGEQYSRHEPLLSVLMVPGYLAAGLPGALVTIALFGALLVRSTVRLFEDEGISSQTTRIVIPLIALGPPIIFYSVRIWPEVPAAFCFVEAIRAVRARREKRWIPALIALSLLKLRFVLVAAVLAVRAIAGHRISRKWAAGALLTVILVPLLIAWMFSGSVLNVHTTHELMPGRSGAYATGLFGLVLDGAAGLLWQAPIYGLALLALVRWRSMPEGFRLGCAAAALYIIYLLPRDEWHGGWSPPLRYIAFLVPILGLGAAAVLDRAKARCSSEIDGWVAVFVGAISIWTLILVIHGIAFPWRLFHIADGQNFIGESLSEAHGADFSRLFPSFIRVNRAAIVGAVVLISALIAYAAGMHRLLARTVRPQVAGGLVALLVAWGLSAARTPGEVVEFEDAYVTHIGGSLYPPIYTVSRFLYRGAWTLHPGDGLSFLFTPGLARIRYDASTPAVLSVNGAMVHLPAGRDVMFRYILKPSNGRVVIRCVSGAVTLDRIDHD